VSGPAAAERLRHELERQGRVWQAPVESYESIGSTSDRLKEMLRAGAPEWSVVLAEQQTAGRGRQGRAWASPPGNLYLSVLLRPGFAPERVSLLPLMAGLAVAEALVWLGVDGRLKWPNDVLVGEQKIAGVLAESASGAQRLDGVVLGIGVNVAAPREALPPEVAAGTTSIFEVTGRRAEPVAVAARVLGQLGVWYDSLRLEGADAVLAAWSARSVPWWGKPVEVWSGSQRTIGLARGVDRRGALLLQGDDGQVRPVLSGDARQVRLR
jgi:BirA family biotin operon repressor/biotin-[acetyl-CoA-carboxylase] ligase